MSSWAYGLSEVYIGRILRILRNSCHPPSQPGQEQAKMVYPRKALAIRVRSEERIESAASRSGEKRRKSFIVSSPSQTHTDHGSQVPPPTNKEMTHRRLRQSRSRSQTLSKKPLPRSTTLFQAAKARQRITVHPAPATPSMLSRGHSSFNTRAHSH